MPFRSLNSEMKRLDEQGDVLGPVAQRRHADADDVDPVVEVLAELALLNRLRRVDICRGDQPHVHRLFLLPAEPADCSLLQHAQQLRLDARRHLGDLVEEQRARMCKLETARTPVDARP